MYPRQITRSTGLFAVMFFVFSISATESYSQSGCGLSSYIDLHISGGAPADRGHVPWQARLEIRGFLCGAVIIGPNHLLTAAHCVHDSPDPSGTLLETEDVRRISVGGLYIYKDLPGEAFPTAAEIIPHPNYDPANFDYDYAIIRLTDRLSFNNYTQPICLPDSCLDEEKFGMCLIAGWGTTDANSHRVSDQLQLGLIPVVNRTICQASFAAKNVQSLKKFRLSDQMLCAGFLTGHIDTCTGDSGGAIACRFNDTNQYMLAGVTSFGDISCGHPGSYGVYARSCQVTTWIKQTIANSQTEAPHQVQVIISAATNSSGFCSGVVVDNDWILTSASCIKSTRPTQVMVRSSAGIDVGTVSKIVKHPRFRRLTRYNFALLKLTASSERPHLTPILYQTSCSSQSECFTSGWQTISGNSSANVNLHKIEVTVRQKEYCKSKVGSTDRKHVICASEQSTRQAVCKADKGSPLVCSDVLVGIASHVHNNNCDTATIFTKVCKVTSWLSSTIADN